MKSASRYPQCYPGAQTHSDTESAVVPKPLQLLWNSGAGCRNRTCDLLITNQLLYRLS